MITTSYKDANLYHDYATGRSVSGVLHFINSTPVDWFTKKQSTVETATYGSEFVTARIAVDQIIDLRLTLRYLGIPIDTFRIFRTKVTYYHAKITRKRYHVQ